MKRKFMQTDPVNFSEVLKKIEIERLKGRIVSSASRGIIEVLNNFTRSVDCKVIKSDVTKLEGDKIFSGLLILTASVTDKGIPKVLDVPIQVENSFFKLPNEKVINIKLAEAKIKDDIKAETAKRVEKLVEQIDKREAKIKKESEDNRKKRELERQGKDVTLPAGGVSGVPSADIAEQIRYPKVDLPLSLVEGDTITISGRKFKVTEGVNSFQGAQPSTEWILILQK